MKWPRTEVGPSSSPAMGAWQGAQVERSPKACEMRENDEPSPGWWQVSHFPVWSVALVGVGLPTWILMVVAFGISSPRYRRRAFNVTRYVPGWALAGILKVNLSGLRRYAQRLAQPARQFPRLVVAAFCKPVIRQRHRHEELRPGRPDPLGTGQQAVDQQGRQFR